MLRRRVAGVTFTLARARMSELRFECGRAPNPKKETHSMAKKAAKKKPAKKKKK
ncbi:MAG: hypothetical protein NT173_15225 [Opitutales bacterium]|nr:hypothetical protein [Opitutales bacterium]